ncbi:GDSL-type esterase/lipase family protein [Aliikangiella sp. G2MR2-5]|uniref:SGNH/GDSL hydrolase family protein n=1 Tax=Aliikangiella sp. G2MR2-5 TaxID=2788943 RepID=UPI0018AC19A4|nr:GDSL-type esterase/lipase family protein [Aliikangiella sp. G2MR2-5]
MINVFCFGDSVTAGEKDEELGGWVNRLHIASIRYLVKSNLQSLRIFNLGLGGETSDGLVSRFEQEVSSRYFKKETNLAILQYGLNDVVIHKNKNIAPIEYYRRNIQTCIKVAREMNLTLLLLGNYYVSEKNNGVIDCHGKLRFNSHIELYNQTLEKLANDFTLDFLDLNKLLSSKIHSEANDRRLIDNDGVHLGRYGHHLLSVYVAKWISDNSEVDQIEFTNMVSSLSQNN